MEPFQTQHHFTFCHGVLPFLSSFSALGSLCRYCFSAKYTGIGLRPFLAPHQSESWNGIEQEITGRVQPKLAYEVTAVVRIYGGNVTNAGIQAILWVQSPDIHDHLQATDKDWVQLQGKFLLNGSPLRAIIFLEGPPSGTDILINSLVVKHAEKVPPSLRPIMKGEAFGVNIIENSNVDDGINGWIPVVRIGPASTSPQIVNVALGVDGNWVNGGQVEFNDERWHEVGGSFRIEKQPSNIMVYVQDPAAGVDLMVAGLCIFPVDRRGRLKFLKKQTDKIRKRDVILKFAKSEVISVSGGFVKVKQTRNSFPFGSCMTRRSMDNEDLVRFLVKNFNWVVFGNELKWSWTEPQQGNLNYKDADELLEFCKNNNLEIRGHCIFWEVEYAIQPWVQSLNKSGLITAIENRLTDLLTRYQGKFRHYDVDNEMLRGSFYKDRLGAPVGHIDSPVGPVVSSALDKLGTLGFRIWFTELDVSSTNEFVRADDLEVMLREAFPHPAVEGIILWGFWELYMSRENAHLVNAEDKINAAGKKYLALKKEWLTHAPGHIDAQGEFRFRGFYGTYKIEISSPTKKINRTFVVDKGELPLAINIDL
ncbi:hypothetical protein POUND7_017992 [Theobroma cacao]